MAKKSTKKLVNKSSWRMFSHWFMLGAAVAVLMAMLGWLKMDIWLASTQWLLVAGVLAAFGVYSKLEG